MGKLSSSVNGAGSGVCYMVYMGCHKCISRLQNKKLGWNISVGTPLFQEMDTVTFISKTLCIDYHSRIMTIVKLLACRFQQFLFLVVPTGACQNFFCAVEIKAVRIRVGIAAMLLSAPS